MASVRGSHLLAQALKAQGMKIFFYLEGGPMLESQEALMEAGIRGIDVRHEQAAAMMAHGWARVTGQVGVCMACAGPGTTNTVTGVANAFVDCAPLVHLGGSAILRRKDTGNFQDIDHVGILHPITKWATQVMDTGRIPEYVNSAFRMAVAGRPGPVYLDLPGDVINGEVKEEEVVVPSPPSEPVHPSADQRSIERAIATLSRAERPVILAGSGVVWSQASPELREFVDQTGIPFYTTPMSRGIIPDDHPLSLPGARSVACRDADVVLLIGSRKNFLWFNLQPPRFSPTMKLIEVDIEPLELGQNRVADIGIAGDAKAVLKQLTAGADHKLKDKRRLEPWVQKLRARHLANVAEIEAKATSDQVPIHPLRLCKEVRDFLERDAVVVCDAHEILMAARQAIFTYHPGHRLECGPFGCMGIGIPFAIAAKLAKPDKQVAVMQGDGSFGFNGMEMDTAVRHKIPIVVVISNNGGWMGSPPEGRKAGYNLGFTRYERIVQALGGHGEYVEKPEDIRAALERAYKAGVPACVNVVTDPHVRASMARGAIVES